MSEENKQNIMEIRVTPADLAYLFDMGEPRIAGIIRERRFVKGEDNKYSLSGTVRDFVGYLRRRIGSNGRGENSGSGKKDQIDIQNELLKVKLAEKQGELIPIDRVSKEWERMVIAVRQKLLAIPTKAAPILASETEPMQVQSILDEMIRESLFELIDDENPSIPEDPGELEEVKKQDLKPFTPPAPAYSFELGRYTPEAFP
jgi:hypothetical protein